MFESALQLLDDSGLKDIHNKSAALFNTFLLVLYERPDKTY